MSILDALKGVLKLALIHDGLARGLREASKALDRRQAHMCVLNEACEEEAYKKLVVGLCAEHAIPLIKVPDGKVLGEWAGLCEFFLLFFLFFLFLFFLFPPPPFYIPLLPPGPRERKGRAFLGGASFHPLDFRLYFPNLLIPHFFFAWDVQVSWTAKAMPAKWSTAPASSCATGAKNRRSDPSCSITSRPRGSKKI